MYKRGGLEFFWILSGMKVLQIQQLTKRQLKDRDFHVGWFLHPIIYGEYPRSLQVIVKERLPKFTADEVGIVKGSVDYVGINQYTAYYVRDQQPNATTLPSYSSDWHAAFVYERNGVPIGPRANSDWL
ncbi:hypothetical protein E2562_028379 [Oryza meyeriana var. granulata]|uniref:Uncharacterized protein n=1 Tax=Oryza meyeriana var. granulata TaxID=110450 RepID=A0A6G1E577_9ORYZ|nr:hypothetical protein E2562_028379 [Oryza meyeriana var. granulata]